MMRTNMHIHFNCSVCGNLLQCPTDNEIAEGVKAKLPYGASNPEPQTGAMCNHTAIFVQPCKNCIGELTGPAKRLQAALSEINLLTGAK
jgi:hypothetical protein